jgi:hypothetical protein
MSMDEVGRGGKAPEKLVTCDKTMCHDPNCEDCYPLAALRKASNETPCTCDGGSPGSCPGCYADNRLAKRLHLLAMVAEPLTIDRGYCPACGNSVPECKCTVYDIKGLEAAKTFASRPCTCKGQGECLSCSAKFALSLHDRNKIVTLVQNHFKKDKKLKPLVKHVRGGLELMDYYLNVLGAIDKVPSPKDVEHEFIIRNTNKKSEKKLQVVNWVFNVALKAAMEDEKFNPKKKWCNECRYGSHCLMSDCECGCGINKPKKKGKKRVTTSRHSARS